VTAVGWVFVLCGLSLMLAEVPSLTPDVGRFMVGLLLAVAGWLFVSDREERERGGGR